MNLPNNVMFVLDRLESHGFSAYLVGGCVRDYVMGIAPHDFDITTNASPDCIQECFKDVKTLDVGKKHGTITVIVDDECIEVTTYRIDGAYFDSRHPESVEFTDNIELDLARRDFTMNAVCYNPRCGYFDCFGGISDIENKLIRCVGDPYVRFEEDALRILRAIRFAARLGFEIDEMTSKAIVDKREFLLNIASERITSEIVWTLKGEYASAVVLSYSVVFEFLFPELLGKIEECCDKLSYGLYGLFSVLEGRDISPILKRMKLDNKTVKSVSSVVLNLPMIAKATDKADVKKLMHSIGTEQARIGFDMLNKHSQIQMLEEIIENNECISLSQLEIKGNDLKSVCTGECVGQVLNMLLFEVMEDKCQNKKNVLFERAKQILRRNHDNR